MSVESRTIGRVRLYKEPNGSANFAVDHTGTLGDYIDVPAIEGTIVMSLGQPMEAAVPLQQYPWGYAEEYLLPKQWELSFELKLATFTTAADDGVAAVQGALGRCLEIALGAERLATGDTVNDAGPTTLDWDVATVARWAVGAALGVVDGGLSGGFGAREIEAISSSNLTFKQAFTAAPSNSDDCYAAATYSLGAGSGDVTTSAQFIVEGRESQDRWVLLGGQCSSIGFTIGPGIVPKVSFTWRGPYWIDGASASTDLTASALAAASYSNEVVNVVQDSVFAFGTVGTTTSPDSLALSVNEVAIEIALNYVPIMTPAGVQTQQGWVHAHQANQATVSGSFKLPFDDLTYFNARDNRTDHYVFYQIGTTAANRCALFSVPTVQVTDVQLVDAGGLQYQQVGWKARHDGDTTESTATQFGLSPVRIHLF